MVTEFKILRNLDGKHGGSDYMEILPGEFKYTYWNQESVFFREEAFDIVETIICARVPSYDHYGNTPIDSHTCWEIIRDLERFASVLTPAATKADLKRLPAFARHSGFFENFDENAPALRQMIRDLVAWLREVMEIERFITIIGV